jgi:hypothetical protein
MTPLFEAAVAARNEAQDLRLRTHTRRRQLQRQRAEIRVLQSRCLRTYGAMFRTRDQRVPSPWSDLPWRRAWHDLDDVLVPLEGGEQSVWRG